MFLDSINSVKQTKTLCKACKARLNGKKRMQEKTHTKEDLVPPECGKEIICD